MGTEHSPKKGPEMEHLINPQMDQDQHPTNGFSTAESYGFGLCPDRQLWGVFFRTDFRGDPIPPGLVVPRRNKRPSEGTSGLKRVGIFAGSLYCLRGQYCYPT